MHVHRALCPDDKMRKRHFLFERPLGLNALNRLFGCPIPSRKSCALRFTGTGRADNLIEISFGGSLEQERNDNDTQWKVFTFPDFNLGQPTFPDLGMEDGLKLFAAGGGGGSTRRPRSTAGRG